MGIATVIGALVLWRRGGEEEVRTVKAERGEVRQEVLFTGRLEAKRSADMAFEVGGTVAQVFAEVGQSVKKGEALVVLDGRLASLELAQAHAQLASGQEQAQLAWQTAEADFTKTKAENTQAVARTRQSVLDAKVELDQQKTVHQKTEAEKGDSVTTEAAVLSLRVQETKYHAAQRALAETQAAADKVNTLKRRVADEAKAKYLATVQASSTDTGLSALEASQALAAVRLEKMTLRAPFNGVVTTLDANVGEYVQPGMVVVAVAATHELELAADVPETDAVKLTAGQAAQVTFDAFGSARVFEAEIVSVSPAAKIVEGVPTFEVKLELVGEDLRPGLTANVTVQAAEKKDVIAVPRRAVITREGREFVRLREMDKEREVEVKTGLLGSDGRVEIVSGLSGGEEVVVGNSQ